MRIKTIDVFFDIYNKFDDTNAYHEDKELRFTQLGSFAEGRETLVEAVTTALYPELPEMLEQYGVNSPEDYDIRVDEIEILVELQNPPKPELSELLIAVDDSWGEGTVVFDKGNGVDRKKILDVTGKYGIAMSFRQLNRIIQMVLDNAKKPQTV